MIAAIVDTLNWMQALAKGNPFAFCTLAGMAALFVAALFSSDKGPTC